MLNGKFSVYGNNDQGPPPADLKRASPINFKFESISSSSLSFDDQLRKELEAFNKKNQPSHSKELIKKWATTGYNKISENIPDSLKNPPQLNFESNVIADYSESLKKKTTEGLSYLKSFIPKPSPQPLIRKPSLIEKKTNEVKTLVKGLVPPKKEKPAPRKPTIDEIRSSVEKIQAAQPKQSKFLDMYNEWTWFFKQSFLSFAKKLGDSIDYLASLPYIYFVKPIISISSLISFHQTKQIFNNSMTRIKSGFDRLENNWNRLVAFIKKPLIALNNSIKQVSNRTAKRLETIADAIEHHILKVINAITSRLVRFAKYVQETFLQPISAWFQWLFSVVSNWLSALVKKAVNALFEVIRPIAKVIKEHFSFHKRLANKLASSLQNGFRVLFETLTLTYKATARHLTFYKRS